MTTPAQDTRWSLTPKDVADQLGFDAYTIRKWADEGQLPCWVTPNGQRRFRQVDIDAFVAMGRR